MNHALGRALAAASFAFLLSATALAQQTTVRVRGTIVEADGSTIVVKSREGDTLTIKVADNARIAGIVKISLADIKRGSYVGSAAVPLGDGTLACAGSPPLSRGHARHRRGPPALRSAAAP
jgi:hypothetical protein